MSWSYEDKEAETWLRLVRAGQTPRSEMETRQGQADALMRLQHHWQKAQSKQAVGRALAGLTFGIQLAPEKPSVRPLKWIPKTGT